MVSPCLIYSIRTFGLVLKMASFFNNISEYVFVMKNVSSSAAPELMLSLVSYFITWLQKDLIANTTKLHFSSISFSTKMASQGFALGSHITLLTEAFHVVQ